MNHMDLLTGWVDISRHEGVTSPDYRVFTLTDNAQVPEYFLRVFQMYYSNRVFYAFGQGAANLGRWRLPRENFVKIAIPCPPVELQRKIVDEIATKVSKVDALIANQQAQIEKLKQYKQALITEVVTKGLNPDAPMKDSGFIYYGQIPAQWKLVATKYLYRIESGATPKSENPDYFDGDIPWITPADYKTDDVFVSGGRRSLTEQGLNSCSTTLIHKGSIIFSKRAPIGSVAINSETLCTNQGCLSCIPRTNDLSKYFYYVMSVMAEQYNLLGSGTTFKEISANNFANFILPQPPIQEQQLIVSFLDEKCSKSQKLISIKTQKIDRMISYKKSLIYEYVTGKKEVV